MIYIIYTLGKRAPSDSLKNRNFIILSVSILYYLKDIHKNNGMLKNCNQFCGHGTV